MTCDEFGRVLPELEGGHNLEQRAHLRVCPSCSELVAELEAISREARFLGLEDEGEPSPRVWNSIEIALRQEGLVREPLTTAVVPFPRNVGRRLTWLIPAFSALLLILGLLVYQNGGRRQLAESRASGVPAQPASVPSVDEQQLVELVATGTPSLRAEFESDLKAVDGYVRDAEESVRSHPNDEIAQQYLMNAYEQKAMVYEMALNRPVP